MPSIYDGSKVVNINGVRHKILGTNKELIPLEVDSPDTRIFAKPQMMLTHRFLVLLHLLLSHLRYNSRKKIFSLEIENLLCSSCSALKFQLSVS